MRDLDYSCEIGGQILFIDQDQDFIYMLMLKMPQSWFLYTYL